MKELKLIKYIRGNLKIKDSSIIKGPGDDAAVIKYKNNKYLLFASDMLVEGVHFSKNASAYQIGWKSVAVNISDIIAMGGIPKYVVTSLSAPAKHSKKILKGVLSGIKAISNKFGLNLVGGDMNSGKNIVIDTAIIGEVERKNITYRSGAKKGDLIFVTGSLGEGRYKHLNFLPRVKEARTLVKNFKINSMIDISDGLLLDLSRLIEESRVGAVLYKSLIPISDKCKKFKDALSQGEDFELLFTLSLNEAKRLMQYVGKNEYPPVTLIGEILPERFGIKMVGDEGKIEKLKAKGYIHF